MGAVISVNFKIFSKMLKIFIFLQQKNFIYYTKNLITANLNST